ncbi:MULTISPECIES: hypothetical protein [Caballeronia]|uniref:hypothetical protein n=1 Tax=Caballeronia TaxID=1827195 RepID=UPI001FCFF8C2|nr:MULTISPECIES: hypothetical protein [Caballeronia]
MKSSSNRRSARAELQAIKAANWRLFVALCVAAWHKALIFRTLCCTFQCSDTSWRGAPSRYGLFYNGPVNFGLPNRTLQGTPPSAPFVSSSP